MKLTGRMLLGVLTCQVVLLGLGADKPDPGKADGAPVLTRVRFFPAPGKEKAMVGGKFTGSNVSGGIGFQVLAEIKTVPPAGQWTELTFANQQVYRWIRYQAPPGSHGNIAEVEFYAGQRKLTGTGYGSPGERAGRTWRLALDGDTSTWFDSDKANNQYVGLDLGVKVTAGKLTLTPGPGEHKEPIQLAIKCDTPDSTIRYTLDGTVPGPEQGMVYTAPLKLDRTTTIVAVAFKKGLAPSQLAFGTYLVGAIKPGLTTFHIGNSLTGTTNQFPLFARTAGRLHKYQSFTAGGALTKKLWDVDYMQRRETWDKLLAGMARIDHFTVQPRDFKIDEEADHDIRFFNLIRKHSPDFQPWLYCEWVESNRQRPTDKGTVPSSQMKPVPALTWEESMAAMLLYVEELQRKIGETYKEGKRPRVIPSSIGHGLDAEPDRSGQVPGRRSRLVLSAALQ